MRISDWSSDVCSSDLRAHRRCRDRPGAVGRPRDRGGAGEGARVAALARRGEIVRSPIQGLSRRIGTHYQRPMTISINAAFDSGNIVVESLAGTTARLSIRKDSESDFYHWFHFRVPCTSRAALALATAGLGGRAEGGR